MGVLQQILATAAIALSAFSLITYLWLGLTVLLLGNRRARVTLVGGGGLLIAALFFLCHGALVGAGTEASSGPVDLWWHLSWLPAFAAPFFWAAIGLHYVRLAGAWGRLRTLALAGAAILGLLAAVLAAMNWRAIASYGDFIRLLSVVLSRQAATSSSVSALASPALPALAVTFVAYVGVCASLPWASLVARRLLPGATRAGVSHGDTDAILLWDPATAWSQARPALLGASLCMVAAGAVVGLIGLLTSFAIRAARLHTLGLGLPLPGAAALPTTPGHLPLALVLADLVVQGALTALVLMVGWAVVRQGVLVERRLPQRGLLGHWRSTVLVAGLVACVVAWLTDLEPDSLASLLVLVALVAATYALFTWRLYAAHDRLLEQLRPFVGSLATGSGSWLATDPRAVDRAVNALFTSLCRDVLDASHGRLAFSVGHLERTFTYFAPNLLSGRADGASASGSSSEPADIPSPHEWVLPVADERGVVARLAFGPRVDGAGYTSADVEVARACGQRILDAVGEFTAVQTIAQLARRRGLEAQLSAALPRRKLHDEILPRLHLAMLRLETLRAGHTAAARRPVTVTNVAGVTEAAEVAAGVNAVPGGMGAGAATALSTPLAEPSTVSADAGNAAGADTPATDLDTQLGEVVRALGGLHHDLAALMRAAPTPSPRRLEHGFVAALRAAVDGEFRGAFDAIDLDLPAEVVAAADALPDTVADLLLGATLEATRNASRHARGGNLHRPLRLHLLVATDDHWVTVKVADDGVGLRSGTRPGDGARGEGARGEGARDVPAAGASTRSGLLTHGALLALVGGSLAVASVPQGGTTVTLRVPRVSEVAEV